MSKDVSLMTTKQFAEKMGVNYRTALNWLEAGLVPRAKRRTSLAGEHWEIPGAALEMERPKRGPKASKKASSAKR
jgi:predicted site-specific integrase-resolvase